MKRILWVALIALLCVNCSSKRKMYVASSYMRPQAYGLYPVQTVWPPFNTESYDHIEENPFLDAKQNPLSTFSIDVDTASYSNIRRFLTEGRMPPKGAVRIEEMVNYFPYQYAPPTAEHPFSIATDVASCPWSAANTLVRIGLKGKEVDLSNRPASNLVFLIDVSGSMGQENKLPLLKSAMLLLAEKLEDRDRVAIAVYAGASGLALPSTPCTAANKGKILNVLQNLHAGGSTQGSAGIQLAYAVAKDNYITSGANRVILCTDGDFNVGITNQDELVRLIEEKAKTGVFLTVLGFGEGNLKDSTMEKLADKGNGNYAYIDTLSEGRKVLLTQMAGTLITIAKDVKIQVEFNPAAVSAYRLIGYENRMLRKEDFNDDKKDAGEMGSGHCVTALYEVVPSGKEIHLPEVDSLKYQQTSLVSNEASGSEMLTLKIRYKAPDGETSSKVELPVFNARKPMDQCPEDFRFAASVAAFGMLLRDSPHKGSMTYAGVIEMAKSSLGPDANGYRAEFVSLVQRAKSLGRSGKDEDER